MLTSFGQVKQELNEYCRNRVRLDTPNKSGVTLRQQLEKQKAQFKKLGKTDEQLDLQYPQLKPFVVPIGFEFLVGAFNDLSVSRSYGAMGDPQPFSYLEIQAYANLMGFEFDPFELEAIRSMDAVTRSEWNKLEAANNN